MDDLNAKLLALFPVRVQVFVALVSILSSLGPKIVEIIRDFHGEDRILRCEKQRLKLLKLRYEIEAFRLEKNLPEIESAPIHGLVAVAQLAISYPRRFIYGVIGGLIYYVIFIIKSASIGLAFHDITLWFYVGVVLMLALCGGSSCLIPKRQARRWVCILMGFSFPLFVAITVGFLAPTK